MKSFINLSGLLLCSFIAVGQPIQFFAHEDHVKPSMNKSYVEWLKKVKQSYEQHQIEMSYVTLAQDDNTYYFFSPMESLNVGMIYNGFAEIQTKLGKDAFNKLFEEKGEYIDYHQEFVTELLPQYTHLAPGEQDNFRRMMFWFPLDGKMEEVQQICKEVIDLHKSKNSPNGYQTFKTIFGGEPGYVVVTWGADEMDNLSKGKERNELLGEEGRKLWDRTMAITKKMYYKTGWFRPDLSYTYKEMTATNK